MIGRISVYVLIALMALAVAVGEGAMAVLVQGGELRFPARGISPPSAEQVNAQRNAWESGTQQSKADYVSKLDELQSEAVKAFLDSHDRLLHYDALTADDVGRMQANQTTLRRLTEQVGELDPPRKYLEHYEVFRAAIDEMHEATQLAYAVASDPTSASQSEFEEYDHHTNEAAARLQRSNKILGRNFATLRDAQEVGLRDESR